jgi:hypothetical protein
MGHKKSNMALSGLSRFLKAFDETQSALASSSVSGDSTCEPLVAEAAEFVSTQRDASMADVVSTRHNKPVERTCTLQDVSPEPPAKKRRVDSDPAAYALPADVRALVPHYTDPSQVPAHLQKCAPSFLTPMPARPGLR